MRWLRVTFLVLACVGPAHGQDIVDVLRQSQQVRLDAMALAPEGERAEVVRASFEKLHRMLPPDVAVELRVIRGSTVAETMHGHIVVANEALAELTEGERLFVLAHELGHVMSGHWAQMGGVYKRWVPGEVTPEHTDPVAGQLGREASALSHQQEYEADAWGVRMLRRLGLPASDAVAAFMHLGMTQDSPTHPSSRKRVAALRAAETPLAGIAGAEAEH
jgi:Peptidase family M48